MCARVASLPCTFAQQITAVLFRLFKSIQDLSEKQVTNTSTTRLLVKFTKAYPLFVILAESMAGVSQVYKHAHTDWEI